MKPCTAQGAGAVYWELGFPCNKTKLFNKPAPFKNNEWCGVNFKNLRK